MLELSNFTTNEVELTYSKWSPTPAPVTSAPLLLLHGVSMCGLSWVGVAETLGGGRREVYAPDSRGHGRSSRVDGGYRLTDYPRDHEAMLRELIGEPAILVGHSLGALNSIFLAAEFPQLVRAVVLEDPPLYANESGLGYLEQTFTVFKQLAERGLDPETIAKHLPMAEVGLPPQLTQVFAQFLSWLDPATLAQVLDGTAAEGWDVDALFERIECPVLLLVGNHALGGTMTAEDVDRARSHVKNFRTTYFEKAGHLIHLEDADAFTQTVLPFLDEIG